LRHLRIGRASSTLGRAPFALVSPGDWLSSLSQRLRRVTIRILMTLLP
jgi:hypothetical protein